MFNSLRRNDQRFARHGSDTVLRLEYREQYVVRTLSGLVRNLKRLA